MATQSHEECSQTVAQHPKQANTFGIYFEESLTNVAIAISISSTLCQTEQPVSKDHTPAYMQTPCMEKRVKGRIVDPYNVAAAAVEVPLIVCCSRS